MEEKGDDFGPLYCDVLKPCSSFQETQNFNCIKPMNFGVVSSNLESNVAKEVESYDGFLSSTCEINGVVNCDVSSFQETRGFNDENPLNSEVGSSNMQANVAKEVESYDALMLSRCEVDNGGVVDDEDLFFDVENQLKHLDFDVLGDLMDGGVHEHEFDVDMLKSPDRVCENQETGVEELGNDRVNIEDSESDYSLDIMLEDVGLDEDVARNDTKDIGENGLDPIRYEDDPDDLDEETEDGEIKEGDQMEFGVDSEARVEYLEPSSRTMPEGTRPGFVPQTILTDYEGNHNQVHSVLHGGNRCGTMFRYVPVPYRRAFGLDVDYSNNKPWTCPDAELSDFFNYDLDEESWQNYCTKLKQRLQISTQSSLQQKQRLQISTQSSPQQKCAPKQQHGNAIQVEISQDERVAYSENYHRRACHSDAIIEIIPLDSHDDMKSMIKDFKYPTLHEHKTCSSTCHKSISGDAILPFPLDGSLHHMSYEEGSFQQLPVDAVEEGRQNDLKSEDIKEKHHADCSEEKKEADKLHCEMLKCNEGSPSHSNNLSRDSKSSWKNGNGSTQRKRMRTNTEEQTADRNGHNCEDTTSTRQGDGDSKQNLSQPHEPKPAADACDKQDTIFDSSDKPGYGASSDDQEHEREEEEKLDEGSEGSPTDEDPLLEEFLANVRSFITEIDELVAGEMHADECGG